MQMLSSLDFRFQSPLLGKLLFKCHLLWLQVTAQTDLLQIFATLHEV